MILQLVKEHQDPVSTGFRLIVVYECAGVEGITRQVTDLPVPR